LYKKTVAKLEDKEKELTRQQQKWTLEKEELATDRTNKGRQVEELQSKVERLKQQIQEKEEAHRDQQLSKESQFQSQV